MDSVRGMNDADLTALAQKCFARLAAIEDRRIELAQLRRRVAFSLEREWPTLTDEQCRGLIAIIERNHAKRTEQGNG